LRDRPSAWTCPPRWSSKWCTPNPASKATPPKGDQARTLETGLVVQVPLFVEEGDVVKVDTRTGEYLSRA